MRKSIPLSCMCAKCVTKARRKLAEPATLLGYVCVLNQEEMLCIKTGISGEIASPAQCLFYMTRPCLQLLWRTLFQSGLPSSPIGLREHNLVALSKKTKILKRGIKVIMANKHG